MCYFNFLQSNFTFISDATAYLATIHREASETASIEVKSEATVVYFDETEGLYKSKRT